MYQIKLYFLYVFNTICFEFFSMALAIVGQIEEERRERVGRVFRDRTRPLDLYTDREMMARYRLDRVCVQYVIEAVTPLVERKTRRSRALSPETIVFSALRYMAGGCMFRDDGDIHGINRMSVSRCVHQTASAIVRTLMERHMSFPRTDAEIECKIQEFYDMHEFPCVIGCIDGSLVPIKGPTNAQDEHLYVCRKRYHALNVQAVVDANMKFLNIVAKWPGSTHDAHIWSNSSLYRLMATNSLNANFEEFWLLGDSGYKCEPYLLTPYPEPQTRGEKEFNKCHRRTRCIVERVFGVWKSRFMCLHKWGGAMLFSPERCCTIIMATAILHNICIDRGLPVVNELGQRVRPRPERDVGEIFDGAQDVAGLRKRDSLVRRVFDHRRT